MILNELSKFLISFKNIFFLNVCEIEEINDVMYDVDYSI